MAGQNHESLDQYCQYDDRELPSRVSVHPARDLQEQLSSLETNLTNQLRAYPEEWLGVLTVRQTSRDAVAEFLSDTPLQQNVCVQSDDSDDRAFDPRRRIIVSTLHSAKGTEFRSIHFIGADDFPYYTREKAFTAVTRAKTTLDVYHSSPMEGALESALAERTVPNLDGILV